MSGIPPEQESVLAEIGMALLSVQHTESLLRFTLRYPLSGPKGVTLETLERSETALKKNTLGQFLRVLKDRVDLDDEFGLALDRFLNARNVFAHRLDDVPGWDLRSKEGRDAAHVFLTELIRSATFISKVLTGLMRSWARQNNMDVPPAPGEESLFAEIDALYTTKVDSIFFAKE